MHNNKHVKHRAADVAHRKLFVGGLSYDTTDAALRSYFLAYGPVVEAVVMCTLTKKSRGFGFITFAVADSVDKVMLKQHSHVLDGKNVNIKRAVPRTEGGSHADKNNSSNVEKYPKRHLEPVPLEQATRNTHHDAVTIESMNASDDEGISYTESAFPSLTAPGATAENGNAIVYTQESTKQKSNMNKSKNGVDGAQNCQVTNTELDNDLLLSTNPSLISESLPKTSDPDNTLMNADPSTVSFGSIFGTSLSSATNSTTMGANATANSNGPYASILESPLLSSSSYAPSASRNDINLLGDLLLSDHHQNSIHSSTNNSLSIPDSLSNGLSSSILDNASSISGSVFPASFSQTSMMSFETDNPSNSAGAMLGDMCSIFNQNSNSTQHNSTMQLPISSSLSNVLDTPICTSSSTTSNHPQSMLNLDGLLSSLSDLAPSDSHIPSYMLDESLFSQPNTATSGGSAAIDSSISTNTTTGTNDADTSSTSMHPTSLSQNTFRVSSSSNSSHPVSTPAISSLPNPHSQLSQIAGLTSSPVVSKKIKESTDTAPADNVHTVVNPNTNTPTSSTNNNITTNTSRNKKANINEYKLFIGRLHQDTRSNDLTKYFTQYGSVVKSEVLFYKGSHITRGFGFVTFEKKSSLEAVLNQSKHIINNKLVEIKIAVPEK